MNVEYHYDNPFDANHLFPTVTKSQDDDDDEDEDGEGGDDNCHDEVMRDACPNHPHRHPPLQHDEYHHHHDDGDVSTISGDTFRMRPYDVPVTDQPPPIEIHVPTPLKSNKTGDRMSRQEDEGEIEIPDWLRHDDDVDDRKPPSQQQQQQQQGSEGPAAQTAAGPAVPPPPPPAFALSPLFTGAPSPALSRPTPPVPLGRQQHQQLTYTHQQQQQLPRRHIPQQQHHPGTRNALLATCGGIRSGAHIPKPKLFPLSSCPTPPAAPLLSRANNHPQTMRSQQQQQPQQAELPSTSTRSSGTGMSSSGHQYQHRQLHRRRQTHQPQTQAAQSRSQRQQNGAATAAASAQHHHARHLTSDTLMSAELLKDTDQWLLSQSQVAGFSINSSSKEECGNKNPQTATAAASNNNASNVAAAATTTTPIKRSGPIWRSKCAVAGGGGGGGGGGAQPPQPPAPPRHATPPKPQHHRQQQQQQQQQPVSPMPPPSSQQQHPLLHSTTNMITNTPPSHHRRILSDTTMGGTGGGYGGGFGGASVASGGGGAGAGAGGRYYTTEQLLSASKPRNKHTRHASFGVVSVGSVVGQSSYTVLRTGSGAAAAGAITGCSSGTTATMGGMTNTCPLTPTLSSSSMSVTAATETAEEYKLVRKVNRRMNEVVAGKSAAAAASSSSSSNHKGCMTGSGSSHHTPNKNQHHPSPSCWSPATSAKQLLGTMKSKLSSTKGAVAFLPSLSHHSNERDRVDLIRSSGCLT